MLGEPRYSAGIRYDPSVLREMAARLEASADVTVVIWTVLGVVLGLVGGAVFGVAIRNPGLGAIAGAIGGGVVGYVIGEHRALEIRFTAQLALCQVAIEENTRALRTGGAPASASGPERPPRRFEPVAPAAPPPVPAADATGGTPPEVEPAMTLPPGLWEAISAPRPGRYVVVTSVPGDFTFRGTIGQVVALEARSGGTWMSYGQGSGSLKSHETYRWAVSVEQAGMLLLMDTEDHPLALMRWTDER